MNKKTKWGIIILVGAGIIGGGIYSQLPKKNDELAAADKVMSWIVNSVITLEKKRLKRP